MEVTIRGTEKELTISTVSIVPEPDSRELHMLNCIHCNYMVVQYQGKIAKINPIVEPYDRPLVINSCPKCNTRYTLQTHARYDADLTKVMLERFDKTEMNVFYCYKHRGRPLIDYVTGIIHMDGRVVSLPFSTHCPHCDQKYFFSDIV